MTAEPTVTTAVDREPDRAEEKRVSEQIDRTSEGLIAQLTRESCIRPAHAPRTINLLREAAQHIESLARDKAAVVAERDEMHAALAEMTAHVGRIVRAVEACLRFRGVNNDYKVSAEMREQIRLATDAAASDELFVEWLASVGDGLAVTGPPHPDDIHIEWAILWPDGRAVEVHTKEGAYEMASVIPDGQVAKRERTSFADVVGEWEVVEVRPLVKPDPMLLDDGNGNCRYCEDGNGGPVPRPCGLHEEKR